MSKRKKSEYTWYEVKEYKSHSFASKEEVRILKDVTSYYVENFGYLPDRKIYTCLSSKTNLEQDIYEDLLIEL